MGQFKDVGNPLLALAEECSELQKEILKLFRFEGNLDEVPVGKTKSRREMIKDEMDDVKYQMERAKKYINSL